VPVAFIDDDPRLQRRTINGVYVYAPRSLPALLNDTQAREVLVAVPSTAAADRKRIIEFLEPFAVHVRLIPDLADLVDGQTVANTRDVAVEDLLGRDGTPLLRLLYGCVRGDGAGRGAGGSSVRAVPPDRARFAARAGAPRPEQCGWPKSIANLQHRRAPCLENAVGNGSVPTARCNAPSRNRRRCIAPRRASAYLVDAANSSENNAAGAYARKRR
jgi:hypothetical protein